MMARLRLDYQRSMLPFPWAGAVLFALASALMALAIVDSRELSGEADLLEARAGHAAASARAVAGRPAAGVRSTADTAQEIKHANEVLQQLSQPWGELFQAIESASVKQVVLLALEPDAEKHVVKISGEAKNIVAVLEYVKKLSEQKVFSSVYLQSHQIQQQDAEKPVRFTLNASWSVSP